MSSSSGLPEESPPDPATRAAAAAELELRRRLREREAQDRSLLDFVPHTTPRWSSPRHLRRIATLFERIARGERVRALVSVPPRHGKTELVLHGIAWLLRRLPHLTHAYASYAADLSRTKSRLCRDYAQAAGVQLRRDSKALHQWNTTEGGGLLATGVGGPLTGKGVDGVLVVDDPHKNRPEAESAAVRAKVQAWWTSTAVTRLEPQASAIVVHTRWHEEDLIGWLQTERAGDWEVIELRALADGSDPGDSRKPGEPLWPERWPAAALRVREEEVGPYDWASLYDQRPRPKGGTVFGDVHFYDTVPAGYRLCIGIDLAYTNKTRSDWNVAVLLAEVEGVYYVLDVHRMQARAPRFFRRLQSLKESRPGARLVIYAAGTERGAVDLMNDGLDNEGEPDDEPDDDEKNGLAGLGIEVFPAIADKYVRAQKTAARWNAGKILLPAPDSPHFGPWVGPFISAIRGFTGLPKGKDDDADALVAAHDALANEPQSPTTADFLDLGDDRSF